MLAAMTAKQIKAIRTKRGETAKEFASTVGVSWRTVQGWEQGRKLSSLAKRTLAQFLKE